MDSDCQFQTFVLFHPVLWDSCPEARRSSCEMYKNNCICYYIVTKCYSSVFMLPLTSNGNSIENKEKGVRKRSQSNCTIAKHFVDIRRIKRQRFSLWPSLITLSRIVPTFPDIRSYSVSIFPDIRSCVVRKFRDVRFHVVPSFRDARSHVVPTFPDIRLEKKKKPIIFFLRAHSKCLKWCCAKTRLNKDSATAEPD